MIVEMFSDIVKGRFRREDAKDKISSDITLQDMKSVFDHLGLPVPEHGVDISMTREGGYNLMLNRYGSVLRIYPSNKKLNEFKDPEWALHVSRTTHLYDKINVTPIGLVQFDGVAIQLMPGLAHDKKIDEELVMKLCKYNRGAGGYDPNSENFGRVLKPVKIRSFDTVMENDVCINKYQSYDCKGLFDKLVKQSELYEDLQHGFMKAWAGEIFFADFWKDMEQAVSDGRLVAGWLDTHMQHRLDISVVPKGDIAALSRAYDRKLEQHLAMKNEDTVDREFVV
ncbi:MAG: hypothetical protein OEY94_06325 [Alphaproteobacteria bacterium]|nr:hypothetical protein [Alphaproteobacteria bacterium]